jgi:hypothetical protein
MTYVVTFGPERPRQLLIGHPLGELPRVDSLLKFADGDA